MIKKIKCFLVGHDWTCKSEQGIKATKQEIDDGIEGFLRYTEMYCSRCGYRSELNDNLKNNLQ